MLTFLSWICEVLGRVQVRTGRSILPSRPVRVVGRAWARMALLRRELSRPNDITVLIGLRNRADYRLTNALRSIRGQTYAADLTRIVVVDYGSEPTSARRAESMCAAYRAEYVRVDDVSVWSRSRCLNVGIRRADTKFLMVSDVDIVLSPEYLSDAVSVLMTSAPSVVCSAMLDLPQRLAEILERTARSGEDIQFDTWKQWCTPRLDFEHHPSICMTYTALYQAMRGYDEYYKVWGWEDADLMQRFLYLGLRRRLPSSRSFYMHQWHPASERGRDGAGGEQVRRNKQYFDKTHAILRNDRHWGVTSRT